MRVIAEGVFGCLGFMAKIFALAGVLLAVVAMFRAAGIDITWLFKA